MNLPQIPPPTPANLALLILGLAGTLGVFSGGAYAAIGIVGAVLLFAAVWRKDGIRPDVAPDIIRFLCVTLLVCVALDFQAAWPALSWGKTLRLASIVLPLALLSGGRIQNAITAQNLIIWPWLLAAGAFALGMELWLDAPLFRLLHHEADAFYTDGKIDPRVLTRYNRGLSYGMLLAWPALAMLWINGQRRNTLILALAFAPALMFTQSRATQLAVMVALAVLLAARIAPTFARRGLGLAAILAVAWPFGAQWVYAHHPEFVMRLPDSWHHRMEIWDFMSYRITERPWLGWGMGSSHMLSPTSPHGGDYLFATGPVGHPHNAFTELWVELGIPGLMLGVWFALMMLRKAGRLAAPMVPFALAAWAAAFTLSLCAYDFWADSLLAAFALTGFAFAVVGRRVCKSPV